MSANELEKIMPPKKSKAARKTEEKKEDKFCNQEGEDIEKSQEFESEKNIFNEELIVEGKRKRNSPLTEQIAKDWLQKHLIEADAPLVLFTSDIYKCYVETSTSNGGVPLVESEFVKVLQFLFPRGYTLNPECPYKDAVRKKKSHKSIPKGVQADSLQLKMKDIIVEAITNLGNPRRGLSMSTMRNYVAGKYPALRLDQREGFFKKAVITQARFQKIECTRGIGACGFYRLPRTPEQEAEEIAKEKANAKEKLQKKKAKLTISTKKKEESGAKGAEEEKEAVDEGGEGKEEKNNEECEDGIEEGGCKSQEDGEMEKENKAAEKSDADGAKKDEKKDKKKKKKKAKKPLSQNKEFVDFENPTRIEDTFPLAMTYNCEPKEASIVKIAKYVGDFYQPDLTKEKLKKCLEQGIEKGFWTQVSGTGSGSGSYRLTIEEFDPTADDDLTGMVMNAIVACTEPKISSASLLKKYIQEYHPELKVVEQPRRFKQALHRAIASSKIKQLSGIGATGSFQLLESFRPSPSILQGKGTMGWPSSENVDDDDFGNSDVEGSGAELFQDAYKPRPSKRRGMGRAVAATKVSRLDLSLYPPAKKIKVQGHVNILRTKSRGSAIKAKPFSSLRKAVKRPAVFVDDNEEDDDDDDDDEDDRDDEVEPEYTPKKYRGRGSADKNLKKAIAGSRQKKKNTPVKVTNGKKTTKNIEASLLKAKRVKRNGKQDEAGTPSKLESRTKKRVSYVEADDEIDEEDEIFETNDVLNMASSPKKIHSAVVPQRKVSSRSSKIVVSPRAKATDSANTQELSVVLNRDIDSSLLSSSKSGGKSTRSAKTSMAFTSKAEIGSASASQLKANKSNGKKKKSKGRY